VSDLCFYLRIHNSNDNNHRKIMSTLVVSANSSNNSKSTVMTMMRRLVGFVPPALLFLALHLYLGRLRVRRQRAADAATSRIPGSLGSLALAETLEFAAGMRKFQKDRFAKHGGGIFKTRIAGKNVVFIANRAVADFVYNAPETHVQAGTLTRSKRS